MTSSSVEQPPSPEYLAETNDPYLDQRVSIAFIVIDTFFLLVFYASRYFNKKAVGWPMLVCNTLCYVLCMGSAATGICESFTLFSYMDCRLARMIRDHEEAFSMLEERKLDITSRCLVQKEKLVERMMHANVP